MSYPEIADSVGARVPFPAVCARTAERRRNKERLEATLAALYELELLRQRQESRVRAALCSGDCPFTDRLPWDALRSQLCVLNAPQDRVKLQTGGLQSAHTGVRSSLEQQVGKLRVNSEVRTADPVELEDKQLSSEEVHEVKENGSSELNSKLVVTHSFLASEKTGDPNSKEMWLSDLARHAIVSDALSKIRDAESSQQDSEESPKIEMLTSGLIQHQALPVKLSKPRTSLAHDAKTVSVVRHGSFSWKDEQPSANQVCSPDISTPSQCPDGGASSAYHELGQYVRIGYADEGLSLNHHHLHQSVTQHQPGLYHNDRHASITNTPQPVPLDYTSPRVPQAHRYCSPTEHDSPQYFLNSPSQAAQTKSSSPEEQLVSAEYIPAQPCHSSTRTYAHHLCSPHRGSESSKSSKSTYSSERDHHQDQVQPFRSSGGQKKFRLNEDKSGISRKAGKKACRSQSQSSLQKLPDRRYNTVERDGGGSGSFGRGTHNTQSKSKKQQPGSSSSRRWLSNQDLSQDSGNQPQRHTSVQNSITSHQKEPFSRRPRKPHQSHAATPTIHSQPRHHRHKENPVERHQLGQPNMEYAYPGHDPESDSSMTEADSPDSTSLSSDSDESGTLVWPQQLPLQLSLPPTPALPGASLQPKAFVKIKASHALKKKILRFRTGSLKLMTTV